MPIVPGQQNEDEKKRRPRTILDDVTKPAPRPINRPRTIIDDALNGEPSEIQRLSASARQAEERDPDESARVLQLNRQTGIAPAVVERNLPRVEAMAGKKFDPAMLTSYAPVTAGWLADDPRHFAVAKDDVDNLSNLEALWTSIKGIGNTFRAIRRGDLANQKESEMARIGRQARARRGDIGEYEMGRYQRLGAEVAGATEGLGGFNTIVYKNAKILGQMAEAVPAAAIGGLAGAGLGAATGPLGLAGGAAVGIRTGFSRTMYERSLGATYNALSEIQGEDGASIDEDVKQKVSMGVAIGESLLELAAVSIIAAPFKAAAKRTIAKASKDVLVNQATRSAAADFFRVYTTAMGGEVVTEVAQELNSVLGEEIAKMGSEGEFEKITSPELFTRLKDIVSETAQGMLLLSLPGASISANNTRHAARLAERKANYFQALGEGIANSTTYQRLPEAMQEMVARHTANGPIETVYVGTEEFTEYWQSKNIDPADVAVELLGSREAWDQAVEQGADLAIPMQTYAMKIAPTEHNAFFSREIRTNPNEMNARQAAERLKQETDELAKEATPEEDAAVDAVVSRLATELQGARPNLYTEEDAKSEVGTLFGNLIRRAARQTGLAPEEALTKLLGGTLRITGPGGQYAVTPTARPGASQAATRMLEGEWSGADTEALAFNQASTAGERVLKPVIRTPDGEIFEGLTHADAYENAVKAGKLSPDHGYGDSEGFSTSLRPFVSRREAYRVFTRAEKESKWTLTGEHLKQAEQLKAKGQNLELNQGLDTQSPAFRAWFGDSKVVDENGDPLVVYHGTVQNFDAFDPSRANIESDWGRGIYFTNTKEDVGANYAGVGPDLENKIERRAEQIQNELESELDEVPRYGSPEGRALRERAVAQARVEMVAHGGATIPVYLSFQNPAVIGGENETTLTWTENFDEETDSYDEPTGTLVDFVEALRQEAGNFEEGGVNDLTGELSQLGVDFDGQVPISKVIEAIKADESFGYHTDPQTGDIASNEIVRAALQRVGFDGIIDSTVDEKFGSQRRIGKAMAGMAPETAHYIAFRPEQIKSAIGNRGTFDPADPIFLNQAAWHGSPHQFDRFDLTKIGTGEGAQAYGWGLYFAGKKEIAKFYRDKLSGGEYEQAQRRAAAVSREPNAKIRIGRDGIEIQLLEKANPSSFIHETGHLYLKILEAMSQDATATEQVKRDYETLLQWSGYGSHAQRLQMMQEATTIQSRIRNENRSATREESARLAELVAPDEKMARGFEAYIMEGKAPSAELRGAFARMRAWMLRVYQAVESLGVELTPEVRSVFGRMVASDEAIAQAEQEQGMGRVAETMRQAGVPEEIVLQIAEAEEEARIAAQEFLAAKIVKDVEREQTQIYQAEREKVRADLAEEMLNDRVAVALAFLSRGQDLNGERIPEDSPLQPFKLSKEGLKEYEDRYPGLLPNLRRFSLYSRKDGVHPDETANLLGFGSGDELIQALMAAQELPWATLDRLADAEMRESDLNLLTPTELPIEAMKAVHNEKRSELNRKILEVMARDDLPALKQAVRRVGRTATGDRVRQEAERIIASKKVREINPLLYQRAEVRSSRAAMEALLKGDLETAFEEQQRASLNHELYRAASRAREEEAKIAKYVRGFEKESARTRLGKAGSDYLAQIDDILDRFEFRRVPIVQMERQRSLREWYDEQVAMGNTPAIPQDVLDEANRTNYRDLTMEELRGIQQTVRVIHHFSTLKNKLFANQKKRAFADLKASLLASISSHHNIKRAPANIVDSLGKSLVEKVNTGIAEHTKMEFLFDFLDGYVGHGIAHETFFQPFADAENQANDYRRGDAKAIKAIFGVYSRSERNKLFSQKLFFPDAKTDKFDGNITKMQTVVLALNWGNQYNREALMEGYGWNPGQVEQILATLTEKDVRVVQGIWDHIETYWPAIAELEQEINGVAPEKVEATPWVTRFGTMRGGYYPIVFDPKRTWLGNKPTGEALDDAPATFRAMTRHGHTEARTGTGGRMLSLNISTLARHLNQVTHDLSHRRAVIDVSKLLADEEIRDAIAVAAGDEIARQLPRWVDSIAGDTPRVYSHWMEGLLGHARAGAAVVGLGLKVTSAALQTLGVLSTIDGIGTKYSRIGLRRFYGNPAKMKERWQFVTERSAMMRDRQENYDRDVRDYVQRSGAASFAPDTSAWFYLIGAMDMMVSLPAWLGAYEKAMDGKVEGINKGDEVRAVAFADKIVRTTQAAGSTKDLAAIQRGGEGQRMFTMFYSSMSIYFNRFQRGGQRVKMNGNVLQFASTLLMMWFLPSVMESLIRGEMPDDEEEESWLEWLFRPERMTFPLETVVGVRDLVSGIKWSEKIGRTDFGNAPILQMYENLYSAGKAVGKMFDEEEDVTRRDVRGIVQTIGTLFKLPTGQGWKSGEYFHDWLVSGEEEPETIVEGLYRALISGKPRD